MSTTTNSLRESFLKLGLDPALAELAAAGRDGPPEAPYVGKGEGDPLADPSALPDPTPGYEKDINAKPNVPGKFEVVDTMPGQNFPRSFEDTLAALSMKVEDVMAVLAGLKLRTTRDQAVATLATWFRARGFKPSDANRAATSLVGPDEFPSGISQALQKKSTGKESRRFVAMDSDGKAALLLEAADEHDAFLYAGRNYGYTSILEIGQTGGIAEAFKQLGLEERETQDWMYSRDIADERDNYKDLPVIQVPYQAPDPRFSRPGKFQYNEGRKPGQQTGGNVDLRERRK